MPPSLPITAAPQKTSRMAISSLVLGILGVFTCGITALFGLIFGIIAMVKVKNSGGKLGGKQLALAGVIVSAIFLIIWIFAALMLPVLAATQTRAVEIACIERVKQLALAVRMYSKDNKDQFPPAATWCDAIRTYVGSEENFQCPNTLPGKRCHYAYNAKLDGLDKSKINPNTVMIFETEGGWNVNGGSELMLKYPRHNEFVFAFANGRVMALPKSQLNTLRWDP
jgi:hypothetical protein